MKGGIKMEHKKIIIDNSEENHAEIEKVVRGFA